MKPENEKHQFLSIEAAAAQLSVSTKTIRRAISTGRLPGYRMGKRVIRVKQSDLADLMRPIPSADSWSRS